MPSCALPDCPEASFSFWSRKLKILATFSFTSEKFSKHFSKFTFRPFSKISCIEKAVCEMFKSPPKSMWKIFYCNFNARDAQCEQPVRPSWQFC